MRAPQDRQPPGWFDELRRPPGSVPAGADRPAPLLFDAEHRPITTKEAWLARRKELRAAWIEFLGQIRAPRAAPVLTVLEEDRPGGDVLRQLIRYEAEPGLPVEAYLLRPEGAVGRRAGVVVLHSTVDYTIRQPAGLEGPAEKFIGLELARRGHVAFCPRCFLWQYGGPRRLEAAVDWLRQRHPDIRGMAKMLFDAVRALDALAAVPEVDPTRLGAIGHSLGAKEALYLAAFDERVRAAVSSEGGLALNQSNWEAPWYLGDAIRRPGFALDHGQVLALVAPRAFLLLGGESADGDASWPTLEAALPVWDLHQAREAIGMFNHRGGHAFPPAAQGRAYGWLDWFLSP